VALVIQEPRRALFARTAAEEIGFSLVRRGWSRAQREARVEELLLRFDLQDCAERSPLRASFGQQHRLAIAAALAARPALALLDEPFAGLDGAGRHALLRILADEQRASSTAYVLASHDRAPLDRWCDRVIELPAPSGPSAAVDDDAEGTAHG
jgi:energy-coupling factor transporter ATP-binding protein EcfA2